MLMPLSNPWFSKKLSDNISWINGICNNCSLYQISWKIDLLQKLQIYYVLIKILNINMYNLIIDKSKLLKLNTIWLICSKCITPNTLFGIILVILQTTTVDISDQNMQNKMTIKAIYRTIYKWMQLPF